MNPMLKVAVKVKDRVELQKKIFDAVKHLDRQDVLVGIPQEAASQRGSVNQAELAFIHTYGSPARGIPARPFLEPSIEKNKAELGGYLKRASDAASRGNIAGVDSALKSAGMAAANKARLYFTEANGWQELKPATIRARKKKMSKAKIAATNKMINDAGGDTRAGHAPLIDTGSMRDAITHVVREKGAPR